MTEAFLHYIWQYQYFDKTDLSTTAGQPVVIFAPGIRNGNSGPDFFNARVRINQIDWVGNVEIHINASGWSDHRHDEDRAYDNVILHVVWNDDVSIQRKDGSLLPSIELKHRISEPLFLRYDHLVHNAGNIPCARLMHQVTDVIKISSAHKALMQRLEGRAQAVAALLQRTGNDWEETAYQLLVRNFGFKVNAEPFEQLARAIPYRVLMKHSDRLFQVEALLFGQAGFLQEDYDHQYYRSLQREYRLLATKYSLAEKRLKRSQWRFLRLRPANFPSLRIAQLAALLFERRNIFSRILESHSHKTLHLMFAVQQSEFWRHHYRFGDGGKDWVPPIGSSSVDNIIINSVVPLLVAYGKLRDDQVYVDRAVEILEQVPGETNTIIKAWSEIGVQAKSSADSQGLIELYNEFCLKRRCLDCNIGFAIIQPNKG